MSDDLLFPKPSPKDTRPWRKRICKAKGCGVEFWPNQSRSLRFCAKCCKQRHRKPVDKRKRSHPYPSLRNQQWQAKREQSTLFAEMQCGVCGMALKEQKQKFRCGFATDHVLAARFVSSIGRDPHAQINLMPLCSLCHPLKVGAEVKLFQANFYGFVLDLKEKGWPMFRLKKIFEHYDLPTERLPF